MAWCVLIQIPLKFVPKWAQLTISHHCSGSGLVRFNTNAIEVCSKMSPIGNKLPLVQAAAWCVLIQMPLKFVPKWAQLAISHHCSGSGLVRFNTNTTEVCSKMSPNDNKSPLDQAEVWRRTIHKPWASYQIREIAGCACAGNVFPATDFNRNR